MTLSLTASRLTATPVVGAHGLISGRWGYEVVGPISKTTAQRAYHPDRWSGKREQYSPLEAFTFCGNEAQCKALLEKLQSSRALAQQEAAASSERRSKRDIELIAKAKAEAA